MQSLWMLVASFLFAVMGVCVKLASSYYTTSEIVLCRGMIGVLFILGLIRLRGGTVRTPFPRDHFIRGGIGVISLWMWFYSFSLLPVATATTLNYMSSIWIAVMLFVAGWWQGTKKFEWGLAGTVALSFLGVALLMRPSLNADQLLGGAISLASGVLSALVYLQVRKLGLLGEPEYRVVFYFSATGVLAGLVGSVVTGHMPLWHSHSWKGALLVLMIGLTATTAQIAMTRAYRLGNTLVTANLQYTGIVFSSLFGVLIWHDAPGWVGWLGMAIILTSGMLATYRNQRKTQTVAKNVPKVDPIATEV